MAGGSRENKSMKMKKKRKLVNSPDIQKPSKLAKSSENPEREQHQYVEEIEAPLTMEIEQVTTTENNQWSNLDLVLSIQSKEITAHKKVELAYAFIKARASKEDNCIEQDLNTLSTSRLIMYISDWIQSVLISSEKKIRTRDEKHEESQFCVDYRCWEILQFCLEESLRLQVSLSLSRDLLRVISCVARSASHLIDSVHSDIKEPHCTNVDRQLYSTVNNCIKLLFSSHGRLLNGNLDLWTLAVGSLLELVIEMFTHNLQGGEVGLLIIEFSCWVFEPFSKFLRLHPCRKNGFRDFVDKLLGPLLHLLGMLPEQARDSCHVMVPNLFKFAEEILSHGLFHSVHLDTYFSLHGSEKYSSSADERVADAKTVVKSYLRHLFDKLAIFVSERKEHALSGIAEMLRLFVNCVKKFKDLPDSEGLRSIGSSSTKDLPKNGNLTSEKGTLSSSPVCNMKRSIFDFFVLTTEPLLLDLRKHLQTDFESETSMKHVYYTLNSVNKILSTAVHERIYVKVEDNSGGAYLNFFKISYGLLLSCYAKFSQLWKSQWSERSFPQVEILHLVAKEFVCVVRHFLEIDYEIIGDDLISIWLMILTFLAMSHSSETKSKLCPLSSVTIDLGCRMVNLYSELRQVDLVVSALCRGLRLLSFCQGDDETNSLKVLPSSLTLHLDNFAKSGRSLLYSHQFRLAIGNAIKSIPEGQANGYVETLTADISDSLEWMKSAHSSAEECEFWDQNFQHKFSTQTEILGMVLSEIYSLVLDSLPVTTGTSYRIGVSIESLMGKLRPSMTLLVTPEQGGTDEFIYSLLGVTARSKMMECKTYWQHKLPFVLLFFFRLYVTCRNLYRQALSLMPPKSKKKMSGNMADFFTAYSGDDLLEMPHFADEGYFSWVVRPSSSLLSILLSLKDKLLQEGSSDHSCLVYVMHIMILQRLNDLRREIHCVEYILQKTDNEISSKVMDNADLSTHRKKKRKTDKFLSGLKHEAACLTGFIMEYLPVEDEVKHHGSMVSARTSKSSAPYVEENRSWDFGVCTVNRRTLHTAVWWIICQNIDIWCTYAAKRKLKTFLSLLIGYSLPYGRNGDLEESQNHDGEKMKVTKCQISMELLRDTSFYDQEFVCRYILSRINNVFKNLVPSLFKQSAKLNAEFTSSDWTEILGILVDTPMAVKNKPITSYCAYDDLVEGRCNKLASCSPFSLDVAACRSLLNLLCQMMERSLSFKSSSRCLLYLVNFERLLVGSLLDPHGTLCLHEHNELLGLLVSCRRACKYILMTFCCTTESLKSSSVPLFSKSSAPVLWLLRSLHLVVAWRSTLSLGDNDNKVNNTIISLMDQTAYVFFTMSKHQFGLVIHSTLESKGPKVSAVDSERMISTEDDISSETVALIVGALEDEIRGFSPALKDAFSSEKGDVDVPVIDINKLSSVVSCIQGFLWGLERAVNDVGTNYSDLKAKLKKHKHETISRIISFIDMFVEFIGISSQIFLHNDHQMNTLCDDQAQLIIDHGSHVLGTKSSGSGTGYEDQYRLGSVETLLASCSAQNDSDCDGKRKKSPSEATHNSVTGSVELGSFSFNSLRTDFLHSFLDGQNLDAAFFLRRLLIASSAILRLSNVINCSPLSPSVVQIWLGCSELLLTKFSQMIDILDSYSYVWLDGTLSLLEALGSHFPPTLPVGTKDMYTKLVTLSMRAIGKCITLQGKTATLASHDFVSSTKMLTQQAHQPTGLDCLYGLDYLKSRLRMSFKVLFENQSEMHLLFIIQALEQAAVGLRLGSTTTYDVKRESSDWGVVSSVVAAGVDCMDLLLESLRGNKLLNRLKMHMNSLIAALFNIMAHLQGPTIFYVRPNIVTMNKTPDSGSVVLMCVEVLTRIAGKPAQFHLDSHHVAQSLNIPTTLFQGFQNLEAGKAYTSSLWRSMGCNDYKHLEDIILVDRQFAINLYAESCRLLWTVVKHHKSDCVRLFFLLQIALQVLLHCLEFVSADTADRKPNFTWDVEEGVICASYLRRVYEEIRQHKDVFGQHCYMLLSDYIRLFSGYGPLKTGLKRQVDEALRPGVYALVDVCSPKDLQDLHTVFGEGPCRSTLANVKYDYEHNFKYGGKV